MKFLMLSALCVFASCLNASELVQSLHYFSDDRSLEELNELQQLVAKSLYDKRKIDKKSKPCQGAHIKVAVKRNLFDI
ncbi:hypothetical protein Noda2021_02220 [Candidatus Dependentiae bacterium Noda2021]|nr:hypothetical protein Noda2021_02220 [Candidatus Dependentiae bacterium Noda2021]